MKNVIIVLILFFGGCFIIEQCHKSDRTNSNTSSNEVSSAIQEANHPSDVTTETNICGQCGHRFSGRGYSEVSEGVWEETQEPYQSFICSYSCRLKHTGKWETYLKGLKGEASTNMDSSGYSTGSDGRIYENHNCELCNGTGIETATAPSPITGRVEGRVCPMCEGRGRRSY